MATVKPFKVELCGSFHTYELYDDRGREVTDVQAAAECAEELYGDDWQSVYNGEDAIAREDFVDDTDDEDQPTPGDFTITPCGRLGGRSALGRVEGRFVGEFDCDDDAVRAARQIMEDEQFWPNVWIVSDHGNWSLYTD